VAVIKSNDGAPVPELSEAARMYLAGLIDGEGCIQFTSKLQARADGSLPLHPALRITNTSMPLLERIVAVAGCGGIYERSRQSAAHRPLYDVTWSSGQAVELLRQLLPFLVIKRRQAEIVLAWADLDAAGRRGCSAAVREEMARLNQRGADPGDEWVRHGCSVPGCTMRAYQDGDLCYRHWLERGEKYALTCEHCGKAFESSYPGTRFCSALCATQFHYRNRAKPAREAEKAAREKRPCPVCGTPVDRTHYARKIYCSDPCQQKAINDRRKRGPKEPIARTCPQCGEAFEDALGTATYCSVPCRQKAYVARKRKGEGMKPREFSLTCDYCGQTFAAARPDARYCSHRCRIAGWRAEREMKETQG
jgi:endogenous inhibitor of DNA gyrase (YacG/DUF329 family)